MAGELPVLDEIDANAAMRSVANMPANVRNEFLRSIFRNYGDLSRFAVMDNEPPRRPILRRLPSPPTGVAIELNGERIDNNVCTARVMRSRENNNRDSPWPWNGSGRQINLSGVTHQQTRPARHRRNVYVHNLDKTIDRAGLKRAFEACGTIVEAMVIMHIENNEIKSKGLGVVTFLREEDAVKAQREMTGRVIGNQAIDVRIPSVGRWNDATPLRSRTETLNLERLNLGSSPRHNAPRE